MAPSVVRNVPETFCRVLQDALRASITARFVLFDRWFTTGKLVAEIVRTTGLDVIGMVKASPHIRHTYRDRRLTLNPLYRQVVRPQWARTDLIGSPHSRPMQDRFRSKSSSYGTGGGNPMKGAWPM